MKVKVATLTGRPLDWAVLKFLFSKVDGSQFWRSFAKEYSYSQEGTLSMRLIEQEKIELTDNSAEPGNWYWSAHKGYALTFGPTAMVAVARCFVTLKAGEEIDIPDEVMA